MGDDDVGVVRSIRQRLCCTAVAPAHAGYLPQG
jgi:hypothetical protein